MDDDFWEEFTIWCEKSGVSLEHPDDWEAWWDCWKTAVAITQTTEVMK